MKIDPLPQKAAAVTHQTVLDRLSADPRLPPRRRRELCSAVTCFARLVGQPPAAIPLDLAAIRQTLDTVVPASAKISRKRRATMRSDLADGINVSGVRPMLKTAGVKLNAAWRQLMDEAPPWTRHDLSRFARWCSLRGIAPEAVDDSFIERFVAELHSSTLVRNLRYRSKLVRRAWNALVAQHPSSVRSPSRPTRAS
jgi:hypothetical protein